MTTYQTYDRSRLPLGSAPTLDVAARLLLLATGTGRDALETRPDPDSGWCMWLHGRQGWEATGWTSQAAGHEEAEAAILAQVADRGIIAGRIVERRA